MKKSLIIVCISLLLLSCHIKKESSKGFVIISPEIAELFVLVAGADNIVGVAKECDYPSILQEKTQVGNFGAVSLEKIATLNPEYVLTSSLEQQSIADELKKLNIKVISIYPKSIQDMIESVKQIGEITGKKERAMFVQDSLEKEWGELKQTINPVKKRVFIEIYHDPLMTVDNSSFVGELLFLAGGDNIFPKLIRDYCRVKSEDVIVNNPEIIFITYPEMSISQVRTRKGWEKISAIKNNKIYTTEDLNPDYILRAGPRCFDGVKKMRAFINE